jgi:branched-chain amino acid transport system permease protein
VPTLRVKLVACALSGALMAAAGAPLPLYMSFIEPHSVFSLNYSVMALAMAVIGGMSSWIGPVIGAVLVATSQLMAASFSPDLHLLVVGALMVGFVILAPDGVVGLLKRLVQPLGTQPSAPGGKHD